MATSASAGDIPHSTISGSSRRFLPCGVTPLSVPMATFTPAPIALLTDAKCASITIFVFSTDSGGTGTPASAASSTPRGAMSVGTR